MNRLWYLMWGLLLFGCQAAEPEVYLFSFFQDNGQDGLHLAYSPDGLTWTALKGNTSFLTPEVGESRLMRDPCIIRGGDGRYHMVWTTGWNERGIGYAHSADLVHWSPQRYLPVMAHEPTAGNCWAPELYYDAETETYLIYWATTIPGRFPETDSSGDNGRNHRMYYTTTRDFETLTETRLLYDGGFNVIDATIHRIGGEYVMFLKDETRYPEAAKNLRIARSSQLTGPYGPAGPPISDHWVEGPTAIELAGSWVVYFDRYTDHAMGAIRSQDLETWTDISADLHFPAGTRHGTVLRVPASILAGLQAQAAP